MILVQFGIVLMFATFIAFETRQTVRDVPSRNDGRTITLEQQWWEHDELYVVCKVDSLLTHILRWTSQGTGYQGVLMDFKKKAKRICKISFKYPEEKKSENGHTSTFTLNEACTGYTEPW